MYHVELRQFPHNFCRFNMTERELRETILDAWLRNEWIELGERKWNPHQATLKVLDGPQIPMAQLSMGRGWRNASRRSSDVTEQLLAAAPPASHDVPQIKRHTADSLGLQVLARLADEPAPIALAWQLARESHPECSASDCLKLAELALGALAASRLIVLLAVRDADEEPQSLELGEAFEQALFQLDSWAKTGKEATVLMRKA